MALRLDDAIKSAGSAIKTDIKRVASGARAERKQAAQDDFRKRWEKRLGAKGGKR